MIFSKVAEIISTTANCPVEKIKPDSPLASLGLDSLKAITVLYDLEEEYDIEIPNELIEKMQTVNDIVVKIDELRQNAAA